MSNLGPSTATDVQVADPLPAGVTFISATPAQGSCTLDDTTVRCALGTLQRRRRLKSHEPVLGSRSLQDVVRIGEILRAATRT